MTEQIIINGVDVSGCIHYKNQTCIANYLFTNIPFSEAKCKISPNCHYKQLKRKEQECLTLINKNNRLKEKYNTLEMKYDGKNAQYNNLKQECKKYKKYKKCIKDIRDELEYSLHCEAEECGCDDDSECLKCTINLILKKINEVENESK